MSQDVRRRARRIHDALVCPSCGHDLSRPAPVKESDEDAAQRAVVSLRAFRAKSVAASVGRDVADRTMADWRNVAEEESWDDLRTAGIIVRLRSAIGEVSHGGSW